MPAPERFVDRSAGCKLLQVGRKIRDDFTVRLFISHADLYRIKLIEKMGITHYPVCIAKTQYSFSADPKIYGAVNNFEFHIKDIVINNGAEMIVAIAGEILRMPGLPKEPQALHIDIVDGEIEGLS